MTAAEGARQVILIGRNDADALATGWHPLQEGPAGVPCRWVSPRAAFRLEAEPRARAICVTVSAPARLRGLQPGLSVYYEGKFLGHCANLGAEGAWTTAIVPIEADAGEALRGAGSPLTLELAVEHRAEGIVTPLAFVPHEVMGNGDLRELGVLVSSVRWITD